MGVRAGQDWEERGGWYTWGGAGGAGEGGVGGFRGGTTVG